MKYLYKYRSLSGEDVKFTERSITHQELYFSHAKSFNDPFDCLPGVSLNASKKEFKEYLNGFFKRNHPHTNRQDRASNIKDIIKDPQRNQSSRQVIQLLEKGVETAMDLAGVLCLSENDRNILMWSHYTDCHKGICLKFKVDDHDSFFSEALKINYNTERPSMNLIKDPPEIIHKKTLLTKAKCWEYEQELRMVSPKRKPGVHCYPTEQLDGIILGIKTSKENKKLVRNWISTLDFKVELLQAKINKKSYNIDIEPA